MVEATGYGTGPGLGGWNCRHSMLPYYEGMRRVYTDEQLEELKNQDIINKDFNVKNNSPIDKEVGESIYINKEVNELANKIYQKYKRNGYENGSLITVRENKILGGINTSYSKNSIELSVFQKTLLNKEKTRETLFLHNHPSNNTFSKEDIKSLIENKKICGIIAIGEHYNYFLEYSNIEVKFDEVWNEILNEIKETLKNNYKNINLLTNEKMHEIYVEVFKKKGLNYGRKRR